jgi:hypothetical protein
VTSAGSYSHDPPPAAAACSDRALHVARCVRSARRTIRWWIARTVHRIQVPQRPRRLSVLGNRTIALSFWRDIFASGADAARRPLHQVGPRRCSPIGSARSLSPEPWSGGGASHRRTGALGGRTTRPERALSKRLSHSSSAKRLSHVVPPPGLSGRALIARQAVGLQQRSLPEKCGDPRRPSRGRRGWRPRPGSGFPTGRPRVARASAERGGVAVEPRVSTSDPERRMRFLWSIGRPRLGHSAGLGCDQDATSKFVRGAFACTLSHMTLGSPALRLSRICRAFHSGAEPRLKRTTGLEPATFGLGRQGTAEAAK